MQNILTHIKEYYRVDVDEFIKLYSEGLGRKDIAESIGVTESTVRSVAGLLSLRLNKLYRDEDVNALKVRLNQVSNNELTNVLKQNDMLAKELYKTKSSLQLYRDKLNLVNRQLRDNIRENNVYEELQKVVLENLDYGEFSELATLPYVGQKSNGLTIIALSDLHINLLVDPKDVGGMNEFNLQIAKERLEKVFTTAINNSKSKKVVVALLGDEISGIIHNHIFTDELPITQAIIKFSKILAELTNSLNQHFEEVNVTVVGGNHSRFTEKTNSYQKGYDFTHLFVELYKNLLTKNIKVEYSLNGYIKLNLPNNKFGLLFHGDQDRGYSPVKDTTVLRMLEKGRQMFGVDFSLLLNGHYHKHLKAHLPNGGWAIQCGTLVGVDDYAFTNGFLLVPPSQTILEYTDAGDLLWEIVVQFDKKD